MGNFQTVELGEITLKKGIQQLTFTGGKKDEVWDFVRLKSIVLEPIEK